MRVHNHKRVFGVIAAVGLGSFAALAGSATWDFNTDPTTGPNPLALIGGGNGGGDWLADGGVTGATGDGYLSITGPTAGQWAKIFFPDIDNGKIIAAFTFECVLRIGNGTASPADGFSINYARANDPTFTKNANGDYQNGGWSGTQNEPGSVNGSMAGLPEEGTITGLAIGFDAWLSGSLAWPAGLNDGLTDIIGISVRVDNKIITQAALPTANGACDDITSAQTGPISPNGSADTSTLCWQPFKVQLTEDQFLTIWWKGNPVVNNLKIDFAPSAGRLVFGGRTGDAYQNTHMDNIKLDTVGAAKVIIGAATGTPIGFTMTASDSGDSKVDKNTIEIKLDDVVVPVTSATENAGAWTVVYKDATKPLIPGSSHKATMTLKDTNGETIGPKDSTFTVPDYMTVPPEYAVTGVDTAAPGFNVKTYQVAAVTDNQINLSELLLHGDVGPNVADLTGFTSGVYTETGVLNYSRLLPTGLIEAAGNYITRLDANGDPLPDSRPDKQLPGMPSATLPDGTGAFYNNDNAAMDITTYIQFPKAGVYSLIFNSDDGFRTQLGKGDGASDQLNSMILSQADVGRGATDTSVLLYVPTAGFYSLRSLWMEGNGGANLEWSAVNDDGVRALLNDSATPGSLMTYRTSTGAKPPVVKFLTPTRRVTVGGNGNQRVRPDNMFKAEIVDGTTATVSPGNVALSINGVPATGASITKSGSVTTVMYTPAGGLWPSDTVVNGTLDITDSTGATRVDPFSFQTLAYAVVPESMALPASVVDKVATGFLIKTYKVSVLRNNAALDYVSPGNSTMVAETMIKGLFGWPNQADLGFFTGPDDSYIEYYFVNYNGATDQQGSFVANVNYPDNLMPGIPPLSTTPDVKNPTDDYVLQMLTVVDIPAAGFYTMAVNSDDGFRVTVGNPAEGNYALMPVVIGEFSGGKGASDVVFYFRITKPGLYPMRNLFQEGGGGNNVEWFTVNNTQYTLNNANRSLLGDTAGNAAALACYQYPVTSKGAPWIKSFAPARTSAHRDNNPITGARPGPDTPIKAVIVDGETAVTTASVSLAIDGVAVPAAQVTVTKAGMETTVMHQPATPFAADSTHTVALKFLDRTATWSFQVGTLPTASFFIEAADFNYDGGKSKPEASQLPYLGGAYAGLAGVTGVDFNGPNVDESPYYRYPNTQRTPFSVANDRDRGVNEVQVNFRIGWVGGGQWYNYTRSFPNGKYNVYAALSYDGTGAGQCKGSLQEVSDPTSATPQLTELGLFDRVGTGPQGGWGANALVPLKNTAGDMVELPLSGTKTLRYSAASGDFDYLLFVPAPVAPPEITNVKMNADGSITITWTGGGTLEYTGSLTTPTTWTPLPGASPLTVPNTGDRAVFGRIKR